MLCNGNVIGLLKLKQTGVSIKINLHSLNKVGKYCVVLESVMGGSVWREKVEEVN